MEFRYGMWVDFLLIKVDIIFFKVESDRLIFVVFFSRFFVVLVLDCFLFLVKLIRLSLSVLMWFFFLLVVFIIFMFMVKIEWDFDESVFIRVVFIERFLFLRFIIFFILGILFIGFVVRFLI